MAQVERRNSLGLPDCAQLGIAPPRRPAERCLAKPIAIGRESTQSATLVRVVYGTKIWTDTTTSEFEDSLLLEGQPLLRLGRFDAGFWEIGFARRVDAIVLRSLDLDPVLLGVSGGSRDLASIAISFLQKAKDVEWCMHYIFESPFTGEIEDCQFTGTRGHIAYRAGYLRVSEAAGRICPPEQGSRVAGGVFCQGKLTRLAWLRILRDQADEPIYEIVLRTRDDPNGPFAAQRVIHWDPRAAASAIIRDVPGIPRHPFTGEFLRR